jgi:hypothetical protein
MDPQVYAKIRMKLTTNAADNESYLMKRHSVLLDEETFRLHVLPKVTMIAREQEFYL